VSSEPAPAAAPDSHPSPEGAVSSSPDSAGNGPEPRGDDPSNAGDSSAVLASRMAGLVGLMRSKALRLGFLIVVLALLAVALIDEAGTFWREVQRLSPPVVLLAFVAGLCGLICSMMVWRSLLADLGWPLSVPDAWRNMFIGQLAKYVPGSIWPIIAQTELGADRGIPRPTSAVSVLLSYGVMTCTGGLVAAVALPFAAGGSLARYFWVLFVLPVGVFLLSPPILNRSLGFLLKVLRMAPLQKGVSVKGLLRALAWAVAGWTCNGTMTYVLMRQLAGHGGSTFLLSVGGYALSWVVGFVAVFAPAGAGVREAVMVATLSTRTTGAVALTVALVTRAIAVICDALTGAAAAALVGRRRLRRLRSARAIDALGELSDAPVSDS